MIKLICGSIVSCIFIACLWYGLYQGVETAMLAAKFWTYYIIILACVCFVLMLFAKTEAKEKSAMRDAKESLSLLFGIIATLLWAGVGQYWTASLYMIAVIISVDLSSKEIEGFDNE